MFKQTTLVTFAEGIDDSRKAAIRADLAAWHGADYNVVGTGLLPQANGGDLVWHLHFADEAAWRASGAFAFLDTLDADPAIGRVDGVGYVPKRVALNEPDIVDPIYRTLLVVIEDGVPAEQVAQWSDELAGMPLYISEIRNAAMSATVAGRGLHKWSHVWEQEFPDMAALQGPYMDNAYHWSFVDRWFDPEMPDRIVSLDICHSASTIDAPVIKSY